MLDKRKIRLMTRTAIYEKKYGDEDLRITGYYRKDYVSLNIWITLIWITVGYALAAMLFLLCAGDSIMEGITVMKFLILAAAALGFYVVLLIFYGIGAGSFYKRKHTIAKKRVKRYLRDLTRLEKINMKKEINRS